MPVSPKCKESSYNNIILYKSYCKLYSPTAGCCTVYIAVIDDDSDTPINLPNDLTDDFMITINSTLPVNEETEMILYRGRNNLTHIIVLSLQVECAPDFTGDRCETVIDNCIDPLSNCSGNGECIDGIEIFTCDCLPGYTGEYCETDIDECLTMSGNCSNNGMCIDGINSFTCICESSYTGLQCETAINKSGILSVHVFFLACMNSLLTCSSKGLNWLKNTDQCIYDLVSIMFIIASISS